MQTSDIKALLGDLGRATLRGVRKCPKCGTLNGTRGIACKNKLCGEVFRNGPRLRSSQGLDAVRIVTGSNTQVYSVRLRDKGPDYRGFVQLPLVQGVDAASVDPSILAQHGKCYVETCIRFNELSQNAHVPCLPAQLPEPSVDNRAARLQLLITESAPLPLKNSVLNSQALANDTKQAIWLLANGDDRPHWLQTLDVGNVMVAKCKVSSKHALGFLHFFFTDPSKKKDTSDCKFICSCREFKSYRDRMHCSQKELDSHRRCVHFYACICAFASDDKLAEEFAFYINLDRSTASLVTILTEVTDEQQHDEKSAAAATAVPDTEIIIQTVEEPADMETAQASTALLTLHDAGGGGGGVGALSPTPMKRAATHMTASPSPAKKLAVIGGAPVDENELTLTFHEWLASITDRINESMHYQFDGHPEPLVFHAPQKFFDCLQQRIASGGKKKRLPNSTTAFVRKNA
ncbi:PREDICTED: LOW QUALITY PROTEIN: uncharacterized protein C2orf42-like, partial [Priapulus caudatus]|uniref:LOW QUALITY PROTEIN: uncharacterized protein C2orf42-like n=1 Tax=Priapulus caudatus TaxID=37621 RepID=A0ABM1F262_PRICU